ncbi:hypothetical protein H632_c4121p0, partial [Helicosporidium sp. ATCC 50920]
MLSSSRLALSLALGLALLGAALCDDCSGHGRRDSEGRCVCESPWPSPHSRGWTGPDCSMPVFGSSEESEDLTAWCQGDSCHRLEPNAWSCFALPFAWGEGNWRYFTLSLERTSETGDPDIFGAFVTEQGAAALTPSSSSFQFQDTSASDGRPTNLRMAKADYRAAPGEKSPSDPRGAMLCVHAYGSKPATFDLRAFRS